LCPKRSALYQPTNKEETTMNKKVIISSAIATALTLAAASTFTSTANAAAAKEAAPDKCFGIAKAGKNDCKAGPGTSCAGTAKMDGQKNAWMNVLAGTCEKIVGGSLKEM